MTILRISVHFNNIFVFFLSATYKPIVDQTSIAKNSFPSCALGVAQWKKQCRCMDGWVTNLVLNNVQDLMEKDNKSLLWANNSYMFFYKHKKYRMSIAKVGDL